VAILIAVEPAADTVCSDRTALAVTAAELVPSAATVPAWTSSASAVAVDVPVAMADADRIATRLADVVDTPSDVATNPGRMLSIFAVVVPCPSAWATSTLTAFSVTSAVATPAALVSSDRTAFAPMSAVATPAADVTTGRIPPIVAVVVATPAALATAERIATRLASVVDSPADSAAPDRTTFSVTAVVLVPAAAVAACWTPPADSRVDVVAAPFD